MILEQENLIRLLVEMVKRLLTEFRLPHRRRHLARHKAHFIAERPQLAGDRVDRLLVVAARKIRPADGATEQDIPDKGECTFLLIDHDMARRVAGAVGNAKFGARKFQLVAIMQVIQKIYTRG